MIITIKEYPALRNVLSTALPGYRKHKAIICATNCVTLEGTSWSGGSRSSYSAYSLGGGHVPLRYSTTPVQFGGPESTETVIGPDLLVFETGYFCGKPATVTVFANPETLAKLGIGA